MTELYLRLMLQMGVKLDLLHWQKNRGWRYRRMECLGSYFDLTRRKWQDNEKIYLIIIFMIFAPHEMLFVFIKWGMMRGGKRVAHKREKYIKLIVWETWRKNNIKIDLPEIVSEVLAVVNLAPERPKWLEFLKPIFSGSMNCWYYFDWLRK